jgi:uncharacterized protein (TIGR02453 family)
MFAERAFALLAELEQNNTKDWFDAHRDAVRTELQTPFEHMLERASARLEGGAAPLRGGKHTMFRMHRDVRFSKDKSPYNSHLSGVLTPSGSKAESEGLVYVHLDVEGGFLAAGFYKLDPKALAPLRDAIINDPDGFKAVLTHLERRDLALSDEFVLTRMPKGYDAHADAWFADHIKRQAFYVRASLTRQDWLSDAALDRIVAIAEDAAPLLAFFARR